MRGDGIGLPRLTQRQAATEHLAARASGWHGAAQPCTHHLRGTPMIRPSVVRSIASASGHRMCRTIVLVGTLAGLSGCGDTSSAPHPKSTSEVESRLPADGATPPPDPGPSAPSRPESAAVASPSPDKESTGPSQKPEGEKEKRENPDFRSTLVKAGFDEKGPLAVQLEHYVRFGSKATADKYLRGDKFDRIEIENSKKIEAHRMMLRHAPWEDLLTGFKFQPMVTDDVETRGLVATLRLPLRVRHEFDLALSSIQHRCAGALEVIRASEIDRVRTSFLTKDGSLRRCTPQEAVYIRRNDGVLYYEEAPHTTLTFVFKDKIEVLKDLARNAHDYSVEIRFSKLRYEQLSKWGHFKELSVIASGDDTEGLAISQGFAGASNDEPAYCVTATDVDGKSPQVVIAALKSLRVLDKNAKEVGSFKPFAP